MVELMSPLRWGPTQEPVDVHSYKTSTRKPGQDTEGCGGKPLQDLWQTLFIECSHWTNTKELTSSVWRVLNTQLTNSQEEPEASAKEQPSSVD